MRSPSALELLQVWEWGLNWQPVQRALQLLTVACPTVSPQTLATLSIGQRDACLLTLREWVFGSQLVSVTLCPHCGDRLELSLNVADLRAEALPGLVEGSSQTFSPEVFSLNVEDYQVQFRLPNSLDLATIAHFELEAGQQRLLNNCVLSICDRREAPEKTPEKTLEKTQSVDQLPQSVREAIVNQMAEVDPQADMQLAMHCPVCNHQWQINFDILSFFWSEINVWASRILGEVHTLAAAYGWREADILTLNPHRRQVYLEMVRANQT